MNKDEYTGYSKKHTNHPIRQIEVRNRSLESSKSTEQPNYRMDDDIVFDPLEDSSPHCGSNSELNDGAAGERLRSEASVKSLEKKVDYLLELVQKMDAKLDAHIAAEELHRNREEIATKSIQKSLGAIPGLLTKVKGIEKQIDPQVELKLTWPIESMDELDNLVKIIKEDNAQTDQLRTLFMNSAGGDLRTWFVDDILDNFSTTGKFGRTKLKSSILFTFIANCWATKLGYPLDIVFQTMDRQLIKQRGRKKISNIRAKRKLSPGDIDV